MEAILMQWLYIIIAAVVCVFIWAIFTGKNNNWGGIPMLDYLLGPYMVPFTIRETMEKSAFVDIVNMVTSR